MGYFFGKYLYTGKKKYHFLSLFIPVTYHSLTNGFMAAVDANNIMDMLGTASSISFVAAGIITVIMVIRWQKNKTLDVPVEFH
ncbi:MAG: hypothetical protein K6A70_02280 [Erysipelotrichaceae bacterium]|nr:hypothetical protein [Erysipelotrichaceae bacterium]